MNENRLKLNGDKTHIMIMRTDQSRRKNPDYEISLEIDNEKNIQTIESWEELECNMQLIRGIYSYGFEKSKLNFDKSKFSPISALTGPILALKSQDFPL